MKILMVGKYPPIQGGVSVNSYWTSQFLSEMGHQVEILTNADEVEAEYRLQLTDDDQKLLTGYRQPDLITIHSTRIDERHVFIPQNNPSVSKLVGLGLEVISRMKPDLLWSYYVEPYGVATLLLSKLTGIPYVIRHAGSDVGRLMLTDQLEPLYRQVFKNALVVLTDQFRFDMFSGMGINQNSLMRYASARICSDVFYPKPMPKGEFIVGIYGKPGVAKGSLELVRAMAFLKTEGFQVKVKALWGGRFLSTVKQEIESLDVADRMCIEGYVPHWRIPDFIWGCHMILFLENNFPVAFHGSGIPLESLCCGRPVLTTEEIASKRPDILKKGKNCLIVPSLVLQPQEIALALIQAQAKILEGWPSSQYDWPDSISIEQETKRALARLVAQIQAVMG